MKSKTTWLSICIGSVALFAILVACNNNTGRRFTGRVLDESSGEAIREAKISLDMQAALVPPTIPTDSEGVFVFSVPDGITRVTVQVEKPGYERYSRRV
ncbi:MAG: carboxypeptidase-like regulatory domain-containing protein, partial [Blastocatellia bacterium]